MLTTATPAAQEVSIASSAETPPKAAPYPVLVGTAITGADDEAADDRGERRVLAGDHHDAVGPLEVGERGARR